jgi:CelD/BcsL family acetyltransferase involved in cellulose biosynthesis
MSPRAGFATEHYLAVEDELAREWDDLADRVSAPPFLRPGWFALWLRAFAPSTPSILVVRRHDRLAGLVPLTRRGRSAASMTNDHTPGFDLLAEDEGAADALARALLSSGASQVTLDYVDGEGAGLSSLRRAAVEAGWRLAVRDWERPPYVAVEGTWDEYALGVDGKLRRDLARRRRRLDELGSVTVEIHDGRDRLGDLLGEGFALEPSGWKAARSTAIVSRPETRDFYAGLARWAVGREALRLSFLRLDGRPLAFQLGLEEGGVYFFVKGGYDPASSRFAPAKLLVSEVLRHAFSIGLQRFEFLGPPEPFKLEWTSTCHDLKRVQAFGRTPVAVAAWATAAYARPTASRVRRTLRGRAQQLRLRRSASARPPHS